MHDDAHKYDVGGKLNNENRERAHISQWTLKYRHFALFWGNVICSNVKPSSLCVNLFQCLVQLFCLFHLGTLMWPVIKFISRCREPKNLKSHLKELGIPNSVSTLRKSALLGRNSHHLEKGPWTESKFWGLDQTKTLTFCVPRTMNTCVN